MTLDNLEQLCQEFAKKKDEIDGVKEVLSRLEEEKRDLESRIIASLNESQKSRWDVSGVGTISLVDKWSFKTPKTDEAKSLFFNYLREKGVFESLITVNSQTLNAFAKREMELARDEGKQEFSIPGLEEPSLYQQLSLRKEK